MAFRPIENEGKSVEINIKLLSGGQLPKYTREGDACLDCFSKVKTQVTIKSGDRGRVPLGFALELPVGWEAQVRPRSGFSSVGLDNVLGTIDSNYRGEVHAIIVNDTKRDITIHGGERICQLAIREAPKIYWNVVDEISDTERGDKGFGSSGK